MISKNRAYQTNGHLQCQLTVLNTVQHGRIHSQLNIHLHSVCLLQREQLKLRERSSAQGSAIKGAHVQVSICACLCACQFVCTHVFCVVPCKHQLPADLLICQTDQTQRQRGAGGAEVERNKALTHNTTIQLVLTKRPVLRETLSYWKRCFSDAYLDIKSAGVYYFTSQSMCLLS